MKEKAQLNKVNFYWEDIMNIIVLVICVVLYVFM